MAYLFEERRAARPGRPEEQDTPIYRLKLTPNEIEAVAGRVAELLRARTEVRPVSRRSGPRMVTATEVARWCGVERSWVYAHAEQLGARKIGTGERPRLRFDLNEVSERIAASNDSQPARGSRSTSIPANARFPGDGEVLSSGKEKTAGRRTDAPGPAPKVTLRRDDQPSGDPVDRRRLAFAPAMPSAPRTRR